MEQIKMWDQRVKQISKALRKKPNDPLLQMRYMNTIDKLEREIDKHLW